MVSIASRSSWGALFADGDLTLTGLASEVFVHHTVTATLAPDADPGAERAQMRIIEEIGQSRFGTGISYGCVIFPSSRAYQGTSWNRRGTHTSGRNSTSRAIAFAGNFDVMTPTAGAIATAAEIYAAGRGRWWTTGAPLRGHRDVSSTACPGRHLYARLDQIRRGVTAPPTTPGTGDDDMTPAQAQQLADLHGFLMNGQAGVRNAGASWLRLDAAANSAAAAAADARRTIDTLTGGISGVKHAGEIWSAIVAIRARVNGLPDSITADVNVTDLADLLRESLGAAVADELADRLKAR